jgi:hypothetical protein
MKLILMVQSVNIIKVNLRFLIRTIKKVKKPSLVKLMMVKQDKFYIYSNIKKEDIDAYIAKRTGSSRMVAGSGIEPLTSGL